ncbi:MAG TPA: hypothetical protein VK797_13400 [Tepidisphaeraceae bacterium]|nr:hypothetical protein [Tepidisphaeraceae bacterium]
MKWIRRIILAVVLLVVIVVVVIYLNIGRIVRTAVQTQASSSLNLQTTLDSVSLSLFGGKLGLHQLDVASPHGYSAPHMLEVGDTNVAVSYGQLRNQPVHVASITIDKPTLVIEQQNGVLNFKKAMDQMPKSDTTSSSGQESMKLIIDELTVKDAQVVIRPNLPGMSNEITVPVSSIVMKNVGSGDGAQNGAAMKDVVMQVITALAGNASGSGALPAQLKELMNANIGQTMSQLGAEAQKRLAQAVPGELGQALSAAAKDPQALLKDPSKALNNVEGLLNKSGGNATSQPANQDAIKSLEGLLGGKNK